MAVLVRSKYGGTAYSGSTASSAIAVTTGAEVQIDDLLVAIHGSDYTDGATTTTLSGSGWTTHYVQNGVPASNFAGRVSVSTKAAAGGAETITATTTGGGTACLHLYALGGADPAGVAVADGTNTSTTVSSCTVPSLSAPGAGLVIAGWVPRYSGTTLTASGVSGGSGDVIGEGRYLYHTTALTDFFLSAHEVQAVAGPTPAFTATSGQTMYWTALTAFIPDEPPPAGPELPVVWGRAARSGALIAQL